MPKSKTTTRTPDSVLDFQTALDLFATKAELASALNAVNAMQLELKTIVSRNELEQRWKSEDVRYEKLDRAYDSLIASLDIRRNEILNKIDDNNRAINARFDQHNKDLNAKLDDLKAEKLPKWFVPTLIGIVTPIVGVIVALCSAIITHFWK